MPRYYVHARATCKKKDLSEDDKNVSGVYPVEIHEKVSILYQCKEVLEEFHNYVVIQNLDDFDIRVRTGPKTKHSELLNEDELLAKYAQTPQSWQEFIALPHYKSGLVDFLENTKHESVHLNFTHWDPMITTRAIEYGPLELCTYAPPDHVLRAVGNAIANGMKAEDVINRALNSRTDFLSLCFSGTQTPTENVLLNNPTLASLDIGLAHLATHHNTMNAHMIVQACQLRKSLPALWAALQRQSPAFTNDLPVKLNVFEGLFNDLDTSKRKGLYSSVQLHKITQLLADGNVATPEYTLPSVTL